ncbi:MAG: glutamate-1-semialdehyde 2,1-aminomutase [Nitrospirales bacterium]|nr:glutamate-1-semialdehyde 2,1-aminomutase [Nitrospirales bacterium]
MPPRPAFATPQSLAWFHAAQRVIPGGVNSPVRAFRAVGGQPLFLTRAKGAYVYDLDGHRFLDYVLSWGPMILGHAPAAIVQRLTQVLAQGTSFGAPTVHEVQLAQMITQAVPSMEMVRLVNSGTEAVMSALRVARAYTQREGILKFAGGYHGHADALLVQAGSGVATLGIPDSPGVPASVARQTLTAPYNDYPAVERLVRRYAKRLACIIVEPVAGNMGVVPPHDDFLPRLRALTQRYDILLIFDEVMTGFRVGYGGAQGLYGVTPDLTCLGKIIGGGLPVGAYGGTRAIMQQVAPAGPVYQAGTLSGNPLAVTAGVETLRRLTPGVYRTLEARAAELAEGLGAAAKRAKVPYRQTRVGSMLGGFFTARRVVDYASAQRADTQRYARFFQGLLREGIYVAPSQFEAAFLSTAHTSAMLHHTLAAARRVFKKL